MRFSGLVARDFIDTQRFTPGRTTMFTLAELTEHVGGPGELERIMNLHARVQRIVPNGVSAVVYGDAAGRPLDVTVRKDLTGECGCGRGRCDHVAAAALEWLLAGGA